MTAALREELARLERRLADVEAPGRQTDETAIGRAYRQTLRDDIARLQAQLAADDSGEPGGYDVGDPKGEALRRMV